MVLETFVETYISFFHDTHQFIF